MKGNSTLVDNASTCYIAGTGSFVPPRVLTNHDLERMVDTSDEWITTRTGIKERRIADSTLAASDLAFEAAMKALATAEMTPADLDHIIVGTVTPDRLFPSCACTLQARLKATNAVAFDISAACSGFIFALNVARSMINSGTAKHVLVIGAEALTRITDYTDRSTCVLFGHAAGAVLLTPTPEPGRGIRAIATGSDGSLGDLLLMPAGGSRLPATHETVEKHLHSLKMTGNEVFRIAIRGMETISREALRLANLSVGDIALMIPHQANLRMIDA